MARLLQLLFAVEVPFSMKLIRPLMLALLMSYAGISHAQEPGGQQPPAQKQGGEQEVTITGCLAKGTGAGQFVVSDKDGQKVEFTGTSELDQYANQTVALTGVMTEQGGKPAFQPKSVRRVSPSCQAQ